MKRLEEVKEGTRLIRRKVYKLDGVGKQRTET